jgi:hypothetical protein
MKALLKEKLGRQADLVWTQKREVETTRYFDNGIKRNFNPLDRDCDTIFEIPFVGAPDIPEIGLEAGYLMLQRLISIR